MCSAHVQLATQGTGTPKPLLYKEGHSRAGKTPVVDAAPSNMMSSGAGGDEDEVMTH